MTRFNPVVEALSELQEDTGVPRNLKCRIDEMIVEMKNPNGDSSIIINKMLGELDDLSNDINLQPFVRTQLFNISSILESIE